MKHVIFPGSSWRRALTIVSAFVVWLPSALIAQKYEKSILVANAPGHGTTNIDPSLVNPWGVARATDTVWCVADNVKGVATLYNGSGAKNRVTVTIPHTSGTSVGSPTGIVFNGSNDFGTAFFIFVSLDGTISAWNVVVSSNAIQVVPGSTESVLTGVTIARMGNQRFLYVADLKKGAITVYDTNFQPVELSGTAFQDDQVPSGFAPFNVQNIGNNLYVTYAKQNTTKTFVDFGAGLGFVDVFSPQGLLLLRLQHGDWLNAPWGLTLAPSDFGTFSHKVLVGEFGSGEITAFDAVTGHRDGELKDQNNAVISIGGPGALWALAFGAGVSTSDPKGQPANALYFAAGPNFPNDGLFGTLVPVTTDLTQGSDQ